MHVGAVVPGHAAAVPAEVDPVAGHLGQLPRRHPAPLHGDDVGSLPRLGDERDPGVVLLHEADPAPVGGRHRVQGVADLEQLPAVAAVPVHRHHHAVGRLVVASVLVLGQQDAAAVGREAGPGAALEAGRGGDDLGRTGGGVHHDDVAPQLPGELAAPLVLTAAAEHHELPAVGRERGVAVLRPDLADDARSAAPRRRQPHGAAPLVAPADVRDPLAVRRPGGAELPRLRVLRQRLRSAVGQRHGPEPAQRAEHEGVAVGGDHRPAHQPGLDLVGDGGAGLAHRLGDVEVDLGGERDAGPLAGVRVHLPEAALGEHQEVLVVVEPVHPRVQPVDREPLLLVGIQPVADPGQLARGEVEHLQRRLGADPPDHRQPGPVGGRRGSHRAARLPRDGALLTGRPVVPPDLPDAPVGVPVVGVATAAAAEVDEPAVGGERRLGRAAQPLLLRQLHAGPPQPVGHPQLLQADRRRVGEATPGDDVLAVGGPRRLGVAGRGVVGEGAGAAAVGVHEPQVPVAAAVAAEHERRAVGGPAGVAVPLRAARQPRRRAAVDRQHVQVPQQIEDESIPVGVQIDPHPGPFGGLEGNLPGRRLHFFGGSSGLLRRDVGEGKQGDGEQQEQTTHGTSRGSEGREHPGCSRARQATVEGAPTGMHP